jgi:ankyrin repeat protein
MANAANSGHKEIVQMMLDSGANDSSEAMSAAADGGNKEIVQMIKTYAKNHKQNISEPIYFYFV